MRQIIIEGSREPEIRVKAIEIVRPSQGGFYMNELKLLFEFVRDRIRYIGDPYSEDILQWPNASLELMAADCNNRVILLGALARSIGFPVRLVFSFDIPSPDLQSDFPVHVWLEADINKREEFEQEWVTIETTPSRDRVTHTTTLKVPFGAAYPPGPHREYLTVDD